VLEDLLEDDNTAKHLKVKVAVDLLDRAGFAPVQKHAIMSGAITSDDLAELKARGREAGVVVDADVCNPE